MPKIEFKVKVPRLAWEKIGATYILTSLVRISPLLIEQYALMISRYFGQEVRWNYTDSPQGHYVDFERAVRYASIKQKHVVIHVSGGVAEDVHTPPGVEVHILDFDNAEVDVEGETYIQKQITHLESLGIPWQTSTDREFEQREDAQ